MLIPVVHFHPPVPIAALSLEEGVVVSSAGSGVAGVGPGGPAGLAGASPGGEAITVSETVCQYRNRPK